MVVSILHRVVKNIKENYDPTLRKTPPGVNRNKEILEHHDTINQTNQTINQIKHNTIHHASHKHIPILPP